jgi:hypothetical protein
MGVMTGNLVAAIPMLVSAVAKAEAHPASPPGLIYAIILVIVCSTMLTALALFLIRRWIFGYPLTRKSKPLIDAWALAGKRMKVEDDPDDQLYPPAG